jgi:hypothetical protein
MELKDALAKARQILDEERAFPTVRYEVDVAGIAESSGKVVAAAVALSALSQPNQLAVNRSRRPRSVIERSGMWVLKSENYDLLCALHSRVDSDSRPVFVTSLLHRIGLPGSCLSVANSSYPGIFGYVSELPVISEFCLRNGMTQMFLNAVAEADLTPGIAILLRHLEEIIALNYCVLSDEGQVQLAASITKMFRRFKPVPRRSLDECEFSGKAVRVGWLFDEAKQSVLGLLEQCRKARYFYLKRALSEGLNIEINQDKDAVQSHLKALGFSDPLARSLDEAERLYHDGANEFDLKASMGHLRSFLEGLHNEAFPRLLAKFGGEMPASWGRGLAYLRENAVLSKQEEQFTASLYTIISDEAVHPIVAERQYARLFRNIVIEYALLLLWKLEKLELKR